MKAFWNICCAVAAVIVAIMGAPAMAGSITYAYDELGRVKRVTYPTGAIIEYSYDPNGNRTTYVVTGSSNTAPPSPGPIGQNLLTTQ
jgi:YD repeat-containing protein